MSADTDTVDIVYGSHDTKDVCYTFEEHEGHWYAVDGSVNVNFTRDPITPGCSVEDLHDVDVFTASDPIRSEEQLERAVNDAQS